MVLAFLPVSQTAWAKHAQAKHHKKNLKGSESRIYELPGVVIHEREGKRRRNINRIDRDELVRWDAKSVADALGLLPALQVTTGRRGEYTFYLRGFDQRQVKVLIDGAPAYVPYDGQLDLNMVPSEIVDHVTVVNGPGSVLYGPDGLGGVINIVTRKPGNGPAAEVMLEKGRAGGLRLHGFHTYRTGPVAWLVHGGLERSQGFFLSSSFKPTRSEDGGLRNNSDKGAYDLGTGVRVHLAKGHELLARANYIKANRGVPPSTTDTRLRFWRFTDWEYSNFSLGHHGRYSNALDMDELLYGALFDNLLDSFDNADYTTQTTKKAFHSWYHDRSVGGRIRLRYSWVKTPWGPTLFRLWLSSQYDYHGETWKTNGTRTYHRMLITVGPEVQARFSRRWLMLAGVQADVEVPGQGQDVRLGLGPMLSVRFRPVERMALQVTVARRTRFPTLRERFSGALGVRIPDPGLHPEHAWHFGLDYSWRPLRMLNLQVSAFDAEVGDLIEDVPLGNGKDQLQNIGKARMLGVSTYFEIRPWHWLYFNAGYTFLLARRTDRMQNARLQYRPAHKAVFNLVARPGTWISASTCLVIVGPRPYQDPETLKWGRLGTYYVWNARVEFRPVSTVSLWIAAQNMLDMNYQTQYGFPASGWQVWVGLRAAYPRLSNLRTRY